MNGSFPKSRTFHTRTGSVKGTAAHTISALYYYTITREFGAPDIVIDIGDVAKDWETAMLSHASQMRSRSYVDLRMSAARHLGLSIGVDYAAGFYVNDPVKVAALSDLTLSSRHF